MYKHKSEKINGQINIFKQDKRTYQIKLKTTTNKQKIPPKQTKAKQANTQKLKPGIETKMRYQTIKMSTAL